MTDADTCTAMGDVLSIVVNADTALSQGRMEPSEQGSWYQVASIVLGGVPVRGAGKVSEAVIAFQNLHPSVSLNGYGSRDLGSQSSVAGWESIRQACADAGSELTAVHFTGG